LARWSPPDPCEGGRGGVLLEGATANDLASTLHLRGAILQDDGILYNPSTFFHSKSNEEEKDDALIVRAATPYLWYRSVLQQTLQAEQVFYCHNLHEWAMQYQPESGDGAGQTPPPAPSAKYQSHIPLRVDRSMLNRVVEQKGDLQCTHVDALRYFAPEAAKFNRHG
jgi:hypothetical protein